MNTISRVILLSALACSPAVAQRTWVVNGYGGGDFLDLPPAVAAASAGDTIVVYASPAGGYSTPSITKGITLLQGEPRSNYTHLVVRGIPRGEVLAIHGWGTLAGGDLHLSDSEGDIHLSRCISGASFGAPASGTVQITNCRNVTLNNAFLVDTHVTDSSVLLTQAYMLGKRTVSGDMAGPALTAIDSDVRLVESVLIVNSSIPAPAGPSPTFVPAVRMQGGRLRATGSFEAGFRGGAVCCDQFGNYLGSPAIESDGGEVILDPDVTVQTWGYWPVVVGTSALRYEEAAYLLVPHVLAPSTPGVRVDVYGPPGASVYVCASLPWRPLDTPFGEFWLDPRPGMLMVISTGTIDATGRLYVPNYVNVLMPPGMVTSWQAVVVSGGEIRMTTPVVPVRSWF